MIAPHKRLVELGRVVATPRALAAIAESHDDLGEFLNRHSRGDWGSVSTEEALRNDVAAASGGVCRSVFRTGNGIKLCLVTGAGPEPGTVQTQVMLAVEF